MGKYNSYAKRLDSLAREAFRAYEKAESEYLKAEKDHSEHPVKSGWGAIPEEQVTAKMMEIKFMKAEEGFKKAKEAYRRTLKEAGKIRAELYNEILEDLSAKPGELDEKVISLLSSGLCSPREIVRLYEEADSVTTKRYIAEFAKNEANKEGLSRDEITMLNGLIADSHALVDPDKTEALQTFDVGIEILGRCVNNPSMISFWGTAWDESLSEI